MRWREIPTKHPVLWTCGCFGIGSLPQWFQSVWSLFRTDAPIPIIRDWLAKQDMTPLAISPYWITVPLGILMFLWLVLELRASRSKAKQLAPESVEDFAKALVSKFETETKAISTELPRTPGDHPEESVIEEPLIMVPDNITPEYLVGLYVQHTEIHANSLAKFYIDKGIIVSGFVIDVPEILDLTIAYMRSEPGKVFISLRFDKKWSGRVSILTRNTPIRVIGQIKEISGNKLNLHRCELL